MSTRTTPKTTEALLLKGLKDDAELAKDVSALFAFAAIATAGPPVGLVAGLGLVLQTSGSIVSAATNLIARFRRDDGEAADELPAYDRFRALFMLTTIRAYMEELDARVTALIGEIEASDDHTRFSAHLSNRSRLEVLQEIQIRARDVNDADLTYLFAVEPLTDEVPLLAALSTWLTLSLAAMGLSPSQASSVTARCDEGVRARFRAMIASPDAEATWMRNFLALGSATATERSIEDLRATTATLSGWLQDKASPVATEEAWSEYRRTLVELPNMAGTMYSESFGVSAVFQAPLAEYHVAGARGETGEPQPIDDVGRLLGALVSARTEGQDLIVLSGGPGSGKSTLSRVFASELAKEPSAHPIFLPLRRMKEGAEITQHVEDSLQRRGLVNRISDLLQLPNVVLILDGFDELVAANRSRLRQFFNSLLDEIQTGPLRNAHVVVSGRDTLFPGGQGLPSGSHVVALLPFDAERVASWGRRWRARHADGPGSRFYPERFLPDPGETGDSPLAHLASWPLTLHLVARVHTAGGLPEDAAERDRIDKAYLYRSILAETSSRQAGQVPGKGRLEPEGMRKFLREVAWLMYTRSVDSLDVTDVMPLLDALGTDHAGLEPSQLAEVAVLNAPELSKGEETGFEFVHKSFAEFLTAETIAEQVEVAAYRIPEFGSEEKAWRMSDADAAGALADVLAIRVLPVEVHEMLEPMLGAVLRFREGERVEETVPAETRHEGLEAIVLRCETLFASALRADSGFGRLEDVVRRAPGMTSVLEGLAAYLVGLALVGGAAAGQLNVPAHGRRRFFDADPEPGAFWRFLGLLYAGGVTVDSSLSARMSPNLTVRARDAEGVDAVSIPWSISRLTEVDGFQSSFSDRFRDMYDSAMIRNHLLFIMIALIVNADPDDRVLGLARYAEPWSLDTMTRDPATRLAVELQESGAISFRALDNAVVRWQADGRVIMRELRNADVHGRLQATTTRRALASLVQDVNGMPDLDQRLLNYVLNSLGR